MITSTKNFDFSHVIGVSSGIGTEFFVLFQTSVFVTLESFITLLKLQNVFP